MSRVQIDNISVTNPKAAPSDTIHLALTFSALTALPHTLTWRLTYVGSAFSEEHDQLLEEFEIGPVPQPSTMSFTVEVDPPDLARVPREELLCTAALIMSVSYLEQEFARIGYYVLNTYRGEIEDPSTLSLEEVLAHTDRIIIHEKPRVTKFQIMWQRQEENVQGNEEKQQVEREAGPQRHQNKEREVREQKESEQSEKDGQKAQDPSSTPQGVESFDA